MATVRPKEEEANTITLREIIKRLDAEYFANKSATTEKIYRNYLASGI